MEGQIAGRTAEGRRQSMRVRKLLYSLGWLSLLAIALSAGWKAN